MSPWSTKDDYCCTYLHPSVRCLLVGTQCQTFLLWLFSSLHRGWVHTAPVAPVAAHTAPHEQHVWPSPPSVQNMSMSKLEDGTYLEQV